MKKVIKKKVESVSTLTASSPELLEREYKVCNKVDKLELDLGRGDLNLLRDKINELIEKHNGC